MKQEKITLAASKLVEYLNKCGSKNERDLTIGRDVYKPFYRTNAMFWGPPFLTEVLDEETPTLEEVKQIVRAAHPFFVEALERDEDYFDHFYNLMKDTYE